MTTDATPFPVQEGYLQIPVPGVPYSAIRVPLDGTLERDNLWVEHALFIATLAQKLYAEAFPNAPQEAPQRPAQPQQQAQQGSGDHQTRADKYPLLEGWKCDRCGGPVGRRAATGRMRSDAAVCLGTCKDDQYIHSVGWLGE
jgi:hypothetical protein